MNNPNKITFRAILAWDDMCGIGLNNDLPWKKPEDLKKFRQRTTDSTVIMGKNTQNSIKKPLPNRNNIVVTSAHKNVLSGFKWAISAQDAIRECEKLGITDAWVIGGPGLIKEFIDAGLIQVFYVTTVKGIHRVDTYFDPELIKDWLAINLSTEGDCTFWALYPPKPDEKEPEWEWLKNYYAAKSETDKQILYQIEYKDPYTNVKCTAGVVYELAESYVINEPHPTIKDTLKIIYKNNVLNIIK